MEGEEQQHTATAQPKAGKWYAPLTNVTPLSRTLAALLFIALPFLGFWLGVEWATVENGEEDLPKPQPGIVECQTDAKICPDGTAVGRVGPDCVFAECPRQTAEKPSSYTRCIDMGGVDVTPTTYTARRTCLYENTLAREQCLRNDRYVVVTRTDYNNAGEDHLVKYVMEGVTEPLCEYQISSGDFEIVNDGALWTLALEDDLLLLDRGTGPGLRGLLIYNLATKEKVYEGSYAEPIEIHNGVLYFWNISSLPATSEHCANKQEHEAWGLGSVVQVRTQLDLNTFTTYTTDEHRCVAVQ